MNKFEKRNRERMLLAYNTYSEEEVLNFLLDSNESKDILDNSNAKEGLKKYKNAYDYKTSIFLGMHSLKEDSKINEDIMSNILDSDLCLKDEYKYYENKINDLMSLLTERSLKDSYLILEFVYKKHKEIGFLI